MKHKKLRAGVQERSRKAVLREFREFLQRMEIWADPETWKKSMDALRSGKMVNPMI